MENIDDFERLFRLYYPKVHKFAQMLLRNADDADDVSQMVFLKLWAARGRLAEVRNIDGYVFIVAKRAALGFIEAKKRRIGVFGVGGEGIPDGGTPHDDMVLSETRAFVEAIVSRMPRQRKAVFELSREIGMDNEQIAKRLGVRKKTVENHLNIALRAIRRQIGMLALLAAMCIGIVSRVGGEMCVEL